MTHDDTWLSAFQEWRPAHVAKGSKKPVRPDCFVPKVKNFHIEHLACTF